MTTFTRIALLTALCASTLTAAPKVPDNLILSIHFPPMKTFSDKFMAVARKIKPGQELEMGAMMMLGGIGYPNYPGISETDGLTMFLFETEDMVPQGFIMAKIAPDAPIRNMLPSFNQQVKDVDGWTLISADASGFDLAGDIASLAALNASAQSYDIEARLHLNSARVQEWTNSILAEIADETDENMARVSGLMKLVMTSLDSAESATIGLDLDPTTLKSAFLASFKPGTAEATLMNAPHAGPVPEAAMLAADAPMLMAGRMDMTSLVDYTKALKERALPLVDQDIIKIIDTYLKWVIDYAEMSKGTFAAAMSMTDMNLDMTALYSGNYSSEKVYATMQESVDIMDTIFKLMGMTTDDIQIKYKTEQLDELIDGNPIIRYEQEMPIEGQETMKTEYFYGIADDMMITDTSIERLKKNAKIVQEGEALTNSVASKLGNFETAAFTYLLDIPAYLSMFMTKDNPAFLEMAPVIAMMQGADMKPIMGRLTTGDNSFTLEGGIDVDSIARLVAVVEKMQQRVIQKQQELETSPE